MGHVVSWTQSLLSRWQMPRVTAQSLLSCRKGPMARAQSPPSGRQVLRAIELDTVGGSWSRERDQTSGVSDFGVVLLSSPLALGPCRVSVASAWATVSVGRLPLD